LICIPPLLPLPSCVSGRRRTDDPWPKNPIVYEINTRVWLYELSRKYKKITTRRAMPAKEWDAVAALGTDAVRPAWP
jgi:hypothetical protein